VSYAAAVVELCGIICKNLYFPIESALKIEYTFIIKKPTAGIDLNTIHNTKDNSFKLILNEHELFVEFLKDFIPISILKDVKPEDIEDMNERFLPLFQDAKDSDTIKRIHLKGGIPLFVIAIVEHESEVNHRASFKMLQYITLVLTDYEKEANKAKDGASRAKNFMFPPVLPIVFYDGAGQWTAKINFLDKTELSDVFEKYIPKFEYELVALNQYSQTDLVQFGGILSLILLIDKIQAPDEFGLLSKLPPDYGKRLDALNIPGHLRKLIADVISALLMRINIPKEEIHTVTEKIYTRRIQEMFTLMVPYDVQETRRLEREKTRKEMWDEMEKIIQAREIEAKAREIEAQTREKYLREELEKALKAQEEIREAMQKEMREEMQKEMREEMQKEMQKEIQEAVRKALQAERGSTR
jgi:hypothetical protein